MAPRYNIRIENNSGDRQTYALIAATPNVQGQVNGRVLSHVVKVSQTPPHGSATFQITPDYNAVAGSYNGSPGRGVTASISNSKEVNLGRRESDGANSPGSTVLLRIGEDGGSATVDGPEAPVGSVGAFAFKTGNDFTRQAARDNNIFAGISAAVGGEPALLASFTPVPGTTYQIAPQLKYYVAAGGFQRGEVVSPDELGQVTEIDLASRGLQVKVVHTEYGTLDVQS